MPVMLGELILNVSRLNFSRVDGRRRSKNASIVIREISSQDPPSIYKDKETSFGVNAVAA